MPPGHEVSAGNRNETALEEISPRTPGAESLPKAKFTSKVTAAAYFCAMKGGRAWEMFQQAGSSVGMRSLLRSKWKYQRGVTTHEKTGYNGFTSGPWQSVHFEGTCL